MKKMLFIYNPKSGKTTIRQRLTDIISLFTAGGYDVLAHPTQSRGDATQTVRRFCHDVDLVVCSGGDGTLDEVVTALMEESPESELGYIPSGSTNDFANSLGLSRNLVRAAQDILDGKTYRCDVGKFNSAFFVYVAAFGVFTDVAYKTDQDLKNTFGHLAYLAQAGPQFLHIPSYHLRGEIDGTPVSGNYTYGMITNSRFVGGMKNITGPAVDMDDGIFEVTLVHVPANPIELSEILATLLSRNSQSPLVETYKASRVNLRFDAATEWTLDGEYGGSHEQVEIQNLHRALHLYLPDR